MNDEKQKIEARLQELRYLGTQYAMGGVEAPAALTEEYERLQGQLRYLDDGSQKTSGSAQSLA